MPTKGVLEILIHTETFRNIDLYYQGLYFIQFSAYFKDESRIIQAIPYQIQQPEQTSLSRSLHNLSPAQIIDETNSYMTKIFLVRYSDENVKLGEIGSFRAEVDFDLSQEQIPLIIEAELYFSDLEGNIDGDHIRGIINNPKLSPQFKKVGTTKYKISSPF